MTKQPKAAKRKQPDGTRQEARILLPLPEPVAAWMAFVRPQAPELDETFKRIARLHARQPEHVTTWLDNFKARVAVIAPQMIGAETEKTFRWIEELHAEHPEAMSDLFIQQYKAGIKEDIELEQTLIAEGRAFREEFGRLMSDDVSATGNMLPLFQYFYTQRLCPAWLIGFSDDTVLRQRWEQQKQAERLQSMREAQQNGAAANREAFKKRAAEAWRIYQSGDPQTTQPWPSKEACKLHLMATKQWSRSSCNEYLKDKNKPNG